MQEIVPFVFDDQLVRAVRMGGEVWFIGRDICHALGLRNESDALATLDADERNAGVAISDPSGTKRAIAVSEAGVYRLIFASRKPEAERFKRWLAHDVLPQIRRTGRWQTEGEPEAAEKRIEALADLTPREIAAKLAVLREARISFGPAVARGMWAKLGLPAVPPPPPTALDEALDCLTHLLQHRPHGPNGHCVRELVEQAFDEDVAAAAALAAVGVRLDWLGHTPGIKVANRGTIVHVFHNTEWGGGRHAVMLRRIEGASGAQGRFAGLKSRATWIPLIWLDDAVTINRGEYLEGEAPRPDLGLAGLTAGS